MIGAELAEKIRTLTHNYWTAEVKTAEFQAIAAGKEIGHRIADLVDERTTALLQKSHATKRELDAKGRPRPRSMGDIWLLDKGMYNPINIKAGEAGKNGQPNMVSLTKLLDSLLARQIDSYYLLIVKMRIAGTAAAEEYPEAVVDPSRITPNVYFVDMLDYLDFVTFDAGPGQTMLKEKQFYEAFDAGFRPGELALSNKVSRLAELMEDGDRRLITNRAKKMQRIRLDVQRYQDQGGHVVAQGGLDLG